GTARQIGLEGVAIGHAAAMLFDQLAHGDAGGRHFDAGVLHPTGNGPRADAGMTWLAEACEPFRALLDDVADPPERFDIVVEGWAAEQAILGDVGRAIARQAALAFDRFQHRAFLAADIGTGAAAKLDEARLDDPGRLERRDLSAQDV